MGLFGLFTFLVLLTTVDSNANASDYTTFTVPIPRSMSENDFARSIVDYWTPERMASARSKDEIVSKMTFRRRRAADATNDTRYSTPSVAPSASTNTTTQSRSTGTFSPPAPIGKVFFVMNGQDFLCSASTIYSTNRDSVLTAAHCVYDTSLKMWASKFIFVPQYSNNAKPYGSWTARYFAAMSG